MKETRHTDGYSLRASKKWKMGACNRYSSRVNYLIDSDELIRRAPRLEVKLTVSLCRLKLLHSKAVTFMAGYENAESSLDVKTEIDGFVSRPSPLVIQKFFII